VATATAPDDRIGPVILESADGMSIRYVHPGVRGISPLHVPGPPVGLCRHSAQRQHLLDGGGRLLGELVARSLSG
jgi:hypothetical protein